MYEIFKKIIQTKFLSEKIPAPSTECAVTIDLLQRNILKTMGRALNIRHVDAGSCNGCELELHALQNPYYNIEGLGIRFVASPRHADLLLVTGPVARNMITALKRTYEAMPDPKMVVALGDCSCTGGIFGNTYATFGALNGLLPVNLTIPGCPPNPTTILQGIITLLQTFEQVKSHADELKGSGII